LSRTLAAGGPRPEQGGSVTGFRDSARADDGELEVRVFSRVNSLQTAPDRIADVARVVRDIVHPGIRGEPGYVGYIVLGDRETGRALGVTLWESEEARERSDTKARQIRPRVEQETGGTMQSVERYDVLFYDIRSQ
jgi:hypothetical protein